jgi:hypothetical protein
MYNTDQPAEGPGGPPGSITNLSQGSSDADPSSSPQTPTLDTEERLPNYDDVRLPQYAETILAGRDQPSPGAILRLLEQRDQIITRSVSLASQRARELQGTLRPSSGQYHDLGDTLLSLQALSDDANRRYLGVRNVVGRIGLLEARIAQSHNVPRRAESMRRHVVLAQAEITRLYREAAAAFDKEQDIADLEAVIENVRTELAARRLRFELRAG